MAYNGIIITRHLQERIRERFPTVFNKIKDDFNHNLRKMIDEGIVNKSFINNTKFMDYLYKKYGYDHTYDFIVNDKIVFVIKKKKAEKIAVACLEKKTVTFIKEVKKFKKKKKEKPIGMDQIEETNIDELLLDIRR